MSNRMSKFDKEKICEEVIKPLLDQVEKECTMRSIPFFAVICTKCDEENGGTHQSWAVATGSRDISMENNMVLKHMMLQKDNGKAFDIVSHSDEIEIEMDSF